MAAKPGELKATWSKSLDDIILDYGGQGVGKSDGSWLNSWLSSHKGFDDTFMNELEARGFDIQTLKISIRKKT